MQKPAKLLLLAVLQLFLGITSHSQVIFKETFDNIGGPVNGGLGTYKFPDGWLLRDVDNKLNVNPFFNDAWERIEEQGFDLPGSDTAAFSTSYHPAASYADDWMWTPPITLPNNTCRLSWSALAPTLGYEDGYEVRIMVAPDVPTGGTGVIGNQLTNSTLLFSIGAENTTWTNRSVLLTAYAGKTVQIAFRNNSYDKDILGIDDVTVENYFSATISSQQNSTCGQANGQATVSVTGGATPYSYSWSPSGGTGTTASGLVAGTYTVTVTDAGGLTTTATTTITTTAGFTASTSQTNVSCNGGSNGSATISNITGGTGPFTYSWSPSGGTGATASGLAAGNYIATITDATNCTLTKNFTITQPSAFSITASQSNVSCNGGSNGSAGVAVTGATAPYTYSWSPSGGTAATATGLAAGTYTVTIRDANNCQTTRNFTITQPVVLSATTSQVNVSCNGGSNGSATVTPSGGTAAYTYSWAPSGGTAATATGLTAGTYTVTIRDANSCQITRTFTITQPTALTATTSQVNPTCSNPGSATVTPSGGTTPYTYSWSPSGGTAATATNLVAGTYTVTVTDAKGCTLTKTVTLTQPSGMTAGTSQTNVSCNGGSNGSATVTPSGGTAPYTYTWSPSGGTAATATGLVAGTYTVTIKDANNCQITRNFTITQPTAFSITASQSNVSCNGGTNGSASVTVTGATAPYTYSWAPSGGTAATATGLAAGTYTVTIRDANNCQTTRNFTITQPVVLSATTNQTNVSCNGGSNGSATVVVSGGTAAYTYSWAPSGGTAATATGLAAGTYTVTIRDANSCQITRTFTITQPTALTATTSQVNPSCSNPGSATVTPSGGTTPYTYSWSPSGGTAATATNLVAGTYTVTVTDAKGCTLTKTVTLTQPSGMTAGTSQTNVSCNGGSNGSATVTPSGGTAPYTYTWSPSGGTGATASGLAAGNYTVTITDASGCSIIKSFTITQPLALSATTTQANISCNGGSNGSATVSPSGGTAPYTYSWAPSGGTAATANNLAAGTYTVTVTDVKGCKLSKSVTIINPPAITITSVNVPANGSYITGNNLDFKVNFSENVIVSTTGGTPYLSVTLNTGGAVKANYISGSGTSSLNFRYVVKSSDLDEDGITLANTIGLSGSTIKNNAGCNAPLQLNNIPSLTGVLIQSKSSQTITFSAIPAKTYGDADFAAGATASSGLPVTYTSSNTQVATITNGIIHIVGIGTTTITASQNGNASYTAATPVSQALTVNKKTITVTAVAKTKVYGTADPALTYTFQPALVGGDAFSGALSRAAGENAGAYNILQNTLALSNNYNIVYNNASFTITKAVLTVTAGNAQVCQGATPDPVSLSYSGFKNNETDAVLTTKPAPSMPSTAVAGTFPIVPSGGVATNYSFTYVNGTLTVTPGPVGNITQTPTDPQVITGFELKAPAGDSYLWNTGATTSQIVVKASGNYSVKITKGSGCTVTLSTQVIMDHVSIPNTFSPNGDGINDYWIIPELTISPNVFVEIVNRDGQVVFYSKNFTQWDGKSKGKTLPAGVYFYRVRKSPGTPAYTGWVNLLR